MGEVIQLKKLTKKVIRLNLCTLLDKEEFKTFQDLKKKAIEISSEYKSDFIRICLMNYNVRFSYDMTKRDIFGLLEKSNAEIIKEEKMVKILVNKKVIGIWYTQPLLKFENGSFMMEIITETTV